MTQGRSARDDPDVVLQRNSTLVVGDADVVPGSSPRSTRCRIDPDGPSLVARDGAGAGPDAGVEVRNDSGRYAAGLRSNGGRGEVPVADENADPGVELDAGFGADGQIRVHDPSYSDPRGARFGAGEGGGSVSVFHASVADPVVVGEAYQASGERDGGGRVRVRAESRNATGELDAGDALLALGGRRETAVTGTASKRGGDLVLRQWAPSGASEDVVVHVSGDANGGSGASNSGYGVASGNRPRVYFDGRNATLELGRGPKANRYEGASGGIRLFSFSTDPYVEAGAETWGGADEERTGELVFRKEAYPSFSIEPRGTVRSTRGGLLFSDGTGAPALRVGTGGVIETKQAVATGTLSAAGPGLPQDFYEVTTGETGAFEMTAGDDASFDVTIANTGSGSYIIDATVSTAGDARLWLEFDTVSAGASTRTLGVRGGASVSTDSETGSFGPGNYRITVSDSNGSDTASLTVT